MSRECSCVTVPHHITAFFVPKYTGDPRTTGSFGVGIIVGPEALVCAGVGSVEKWYPLKGVVEELGLNEIPFKILDPLPYGMGYASSAVASIGAALTLASLYRVPLSKALLAAHVAEVKASTGLGDVQAIASNPLGEGVVIRLRPGPPFHGEIDVIPIPPNVSFISVELGRMSTKNLLLTYDPKVGEILKLLLNELIEEPTFETFVNLSTRYTEALSLLDRVADTRRVGTLIRRTPGLLGYYVKKKLVVLIVEEDLVRDALDYLIKGGLRVRLLERRTAGIKFVDERCKSWLT